MARRQRPNPLISTRTPRPWRSWAAVFAVVLVAALAGTISYTRKGTVKPHGPIVLVSIDTLRADRLPIYGYGKGRTPALDRLASESTVFDRAYAHAPQTLPSHASMFTGLLPFDHKVRDNLGFSLKDGAATIAGAFHRAGYRTAAFVSAFVLRPETGIGQGFEVYDAEFPPAAADRSPAQVQRPGSSTLAAATKWLRAQADDRFLLFFHIYEPHRPYAPPARFAAGDAYDGEVWYSDELVGSLLDVLKERKWYDGATIVLMADHGEGLGDHGELEHGLFLYDEVIRVPWLVRLPNGRRATNRVKEPIQHIDLFPTLAELFGLTLPSGLRGRSLVAALDGRHQLPPQGIYAEALYPRYHFGWSELVSLTDERYRYIKAPHEELYDLERDPGERTNIIGERGQAAAALRSGLDGLIAGRGIDAPSPVSASDRERLAALGYVGTQTASATVAGDTLPDPKDMAGVLRKYRQAVDLIGGERLDEGTALLREILEEHPEMTDVWSQYGAALVRMGRNSEALRAYQQVIKRRLDPTEASGPLGAAAALIALGRLDEARTHAELAVSGAPAPAHQALANIAIAQKQYRRSAQTGGACQSGGSRVAPAGLRSRNDPAQPGSICGGRWIPGQGTTGILAAGIAAVGIVFPHRRLPRPAGALR